MYPSFLDKARCDYIIDMASKRMSRSSLAYQQGQDRALQEQTRTSSGAYLTEQMDQNGVLAWVEERIAAISLLPRENGEVGHGTQAAG